MTRATREDLRALAWRHILYGRPDRSRDQALTLLARLDAEEAGEPRASRTIEDMVATVEVVVSEAGRVRLDWNDFDALDESRRRV